MHFPAHPLWFWLVLSSPFLAWLALWAAANSLDLSLRPLARWLWAGYVVFIAPYLFFGMTTSRRYRKLGFICSLVAWTCYSVAFWIKRRCMFETLRSPGAKWYFPWSGAEFSVPTNTRILVRDINSAIPWYAEKLGLRKPAENPRGEAGIATLRFKADGNSVVLTTRGDFRTGRTPILFTKKIGKMRDLMAARGVDVGTIERDRQGTRYFQVRDPEGNEIEVVEQP